MNQKQYTYRARLTPKGKNIVDVLDGDVVIATSKHAHATVEAALREAQTALDHVSLIRLKSGLSQKEHAIPVDISLNVKERVLIQ